MRLSMDLPTANVDLNLPSVGVSVALPSLNLALQSPVLSPFASVLGSRCRSPGDIKILDYTVDKGVTYYRVQVSIGHVVSTPIVWQLQRRYNDFFKMHVMSPEVSKSARLPPKKFLNIGNFDPEFLAQRRFLLEDYLQQAYMRVNPVLDLSFDSFLGFVQHMAEGVNEYNMKMNAPGLESIPPEIRVSIRDSQVKRDEHLARISRITGYNFSFDCNFESIYHAPIDRPYQPNIGNIVNDYYLKNLADHIEKLCKDSMGKEAFLNKASERRIVFRINEASTRYIQCVFEDGVLFVQAKAKNFNCNITSTGDDIESQL